MDIRKYINETERTYVYRIKTVVPLDDHEMNVIEKTLMKYMPLQITAPVKTMFQSQPLDFPTVKNAEVFMFDVELGLPASSYVITRELTDALGLPEKYVVVRSDNDPTELDTQRINAKREMDEKADKEGLEHGALLDVEDYAEHPEVPADQMYGDQYNSRFLGYLNRVEKERKDSMKVDAKNPLFKWMDMPKNEAEADEGPTAKAKDGENAETAPAGNFDEDGQEYRRVYKGKNGPKVLSRKNERIRKGE